MSPHSCRMGKQPATNVVLRFEIQDTGHGTRACPARSTLPALRPGRKSPPRAAAAVPALASPSSSPTRRPHGRRRRRSTAIVGDGSTFWFTGTVEKTIRIRLRSLRTRLSVLRPGPRAASFRRILIVEDNPINQCAVRLQLKPARLPGRCRAQWFGKLLAVLDHQPY